MQNAAESQAAKDLTWILELKKCPAFEHYFLRRIREKRDAIADQILHDNSIGVEVREGLRYALWQLEELLTMHKREHQMCLNDLKLDQ